MSIVAVTAIVSYN